MGLRLPSATSCCNTGRACTPTARSDLTESAFGRHFLASNRPQLTRGFCLYCHMIPPRMMMVMMMMTTINHFLPQPRTPSSLQEAGTAFAESAKPPCSAGKRY